MTLSRAIDRYLGDLARRGRRPTTLESYRRLLNDFADVVRDSLPGELTLEDYERFLDRWVGSNASTLASGVSLVRGFSRFLYERGYAAEFVAEPLKRPKRSPAEELDVVTITASDVGRMLDACADWQELLCVATAAYLGARRGALARVRRGDVDLTAGTIRFFEKGGKVVEKPMPDEYFAIVRAGRRSRRLGRRGGLPDPESSPSVGKARRTFRQGDLGDDQARCCPGRHQSSCACLPSCVRRAVR